MAPVNRQKHETSLQSNLARRIVAAVMGLPTEPVTLSLDQIEYLNRKLSNLRHDVNNHLSLIVAAAELIRYNPTMIKRMSATLAEQPPKITEEINKFSSEFEKILGISRP